MEFFVLGIAAGFCFTLLAVNLPEEGYTWHDLALEMLSVTATARQRCSRSLMSPRQVPSFATTAITSLEDRLRRTIATVRWQLVKIGGVGILSVEA
jgi:hypothetical protein